MVDGIPHELIEGRVQTRIDWTDRLFSLQVKAPVAPYIAGQFTKLALQDESGEWIRRAYSVVNAPSQILGHETMEFLVIADRDGQLSPRLQRLEAGDVVYVGHTPSGFMTLEEVPKSTEDLWLLSTGTAIGPFLAMLDAIRQGEESGQPRRYQQLVLVHAVRTEQELVYQDKITQLLVLFDGRLRYVPIVSRELVPGTLRGRIPQFIRDGALARAAGCQLGSASFVYLCGNPAMVKETSQALASLGFSKHLRRKPGQFSSENYW